LTSARRWDANRIENDAHLINQPTLLIWGEDDNVIPVRNGEKLYDSILNSRLVVLKDCGHVPPEENPERFVELVSEFCRNKKGRCLEIPVMPDNFPVENSIFDFRSAADIVNDEIAFRAFVINV
jgi:hypothetical protein